MQNYKHALVFVLILFSACAGNEPEQAGKYEIEKSPSESPAYSSEKNRQKQKKLPVKRTGIELTENESTDHLAGYLISSSSKQYFDDWSLGDAELVLTTQPYKRTNSQAISIGKIKADGSFDFDLPAGMVADRSIDRMFKCIYIEMDKRPETSYLAPQSKLISAWLTVVKEGRQMGVLSLGTSKQQVYNYSPAGQYAGNKGYVLHYWFAEQATSAKTTCQREIEVFDGRKDRKIEIEDIYELEFGKGWNWIKTEIVENQKVGSKLFYKTKKYTVTKKLPEEVRWVFFKY